MLRPIVQVGLLQHTAECALAVTFLQLSQGAAEGRTPEVTPPLSLSFSVCFHWSEWQRQPLADSCI